MFAFVKSFFISKGPEEQLDENHDGSSDSEHSSRSSLTNPQHEQHGDADGPDTSSSRSSVSSVEVIHETRPGAGQTIGQQSNTSTTADLPSTAPGDPEEDPWPLTGALYWVDGVQFACTMEHCEVDVDGQMLVIKDIDALHPGVVNTKLFKVDCLCNVRQHLPDSFQFFVREGNDGGEEYGIQFDSLLKALVFRQHIFNALLETAVHAVEVECALAEYDSANREFVLISRSASVFLSERQSDRQMYFSVEDRKVDDEEDPMKRRFFVDNLTKEIQMWPSVQTNQLTVWGVHHQTVGIDKAMFILELDVATVGKTAIAHFFNSLAVALADRSFLLETGDKQDDVQSVPMDDEGFDIGELGDPEVHREWRDKRTSRSSTRRRRRTGDRRNSSSDEDDEYGGQEEEEEEDVHPRYTTEPVYASDHSLLHRFMAVSGDRTFVCRGDQSSPRHFTRRKGTQLQLKIYKRKEDEDGEERLEGVGTVEGKKFSYKGQNFLPSKGLLHQQEKQLLIAPESDYNGDVYLMDLATEQVVQKWDASGTSVQTMFPSYKGAQASLDPTFLCSNNKNVFVMDTRMTDHAKATGINYLTNPQLSVGATDSDGHIVMGSRLGALRLYDGETNAKGDIKRAKTLLETIREPIIAVDVTKDGSWVVATTKTFLVVFCTKLSGTGKTGFETALGQQKPLPRYLMLMAEDFVKYKITEIDFAPAKFDAEEDSIVTSSGNMAVVWDFGTVKRGKPVYSVRFATDAIKDVQISKDSESVVVAYPTAVGLFGTERKRIGDISR